MRTALIESATPDLSGIGPTVDINGATLAVGTRVWSFDFGAVESEGVWGMNLEGERADYFEGVIEAIGEVVHEGSPRYTIRVARQIIHGKVVPNPAAETIYPPVNGLTRMPGNMPTVAVVAVTTA